MIGFFDSGFGGLTVMKSVVERLPSYDYYYLGDNARVPYGTRSARLVYEFTRQAVDYLFREGCPIIIIACNTASAGALRRIQQEYLPRAWPERRVLGVVRPSAEAVVERGGRRVGILATEGVVTSQAYITEIHKLDPSVHVVQQACPLLVPIVEAGEHDRPVAAAAVAAYMESLFEQADRLDTILLACTHYPVLKNQLERQAPPGVEIVEQGPVVAEKLEYYFRRHPRIENMISREGKRLFRTTDSCDRFDRLAGMFYGKSISSELVRLEGAS